MTALNQCPVCQARFRGARVCSRCGADLGPLMMRAAKAWRLRQQARQSIGGEDTEAAFRLASQAQELRWTRSGESLRWLSAWRKALLR